MAELFDTLLYRIEETYPEEKTSRLFYTSMKYLFTKYNPSYNRGVDLELYKKHCYRFISILVEFEADYNTIIAAMLYPIYYHNATDRKEVQLLV
ncbi:MAG: hypothetical protein U9Q15_02275 [Patescibacteria group bacterium]|nr:hypothetical protein [Patescibacteria group bacterium]